MRCATATKTDGPTGTTIASDLDEPNGVARDGDLYVARSGGSSAIAAS
jgi:hypothetical protein